jgi:hypothetical protein
MNQVTQLLSALEQGDPHAASRLLPLVYEELRRLAAAHMAREKPGQTLRPTALVQHPLQMHEDNEEKCLAAVCLSGVDHFGPLRIGHD